MQPLNGLTKGRNPLAVWYERVGSPGLALTVLVFALYLPSLFGGFLLDDHRCLRLLGEYRRGERVSLDGYRFIFGGEANQTARKAGWYPWWISDDLRYLHMRPVSEWFLYGEYTLFGERVIAFRLVGLALYAIGVGVVLRIFRLISGNEMVARWAAMLFAVCAGHAIPVVFVSNHCDLIALVLAAGAALAVGRFIRDGPISGLVVGVALFGLGLGAKEATLPVVASAVCFWLAFRGRQGVALRAVVCGSLMAAVALAWLGHYASHGYGSNALPMLDPLRAPAEYLLALPGRAILLLTTWVIPVNPFMFLLHRDWGWLRYVHGAAGGAILVILGCMYWRHHRRQPGVIAMALWPLPFLPLLACTVPDDRVMVLPSIGLAFLGAAWMTRPRAAASSKAATVGERLPLPPRGSLLFSGRSGHNLDAACSHGPDGEHVAAGGGLRKLPFLLFAVLQAMTVLAATGLVQFMETEAQRHLKIMVEGFGREVRDGDHLFILNNARDFETLFAQDRLWSVRGRTDVRLSVLSDIVAPTVRILDSHTLRLESDGAPFFSSFVGMMGTSRTRPRDEGDAFDAGEFTGRIAAVEAGQVRAVELRFRRPLTSDSYRFYWSSPTAPPVLAPQIHAAIGASGTSQT